MTHTAEAVRSCSSRGRWSALNIVLMIVGFAVFWPLGLAMLAWIIWGDEIGRITGDLKAQFRSWGGNASFRPAAAWGETGNVAFDEYRAAELKRLEEERRKLDALRAEFDTFLKELRRVKDQQEFEKFMDSYRNRTGGESA
ncbi:DUF2852 domain-containing protein [Faunimonas sp. B44]